MSDDAKEKIRKAVEKYKERGHSAEEAVRKTSKMFTDVSSDYVRKMASTVYKGAKKGSRKVSEKKDPEMMDAEGDSGSSSEDMDEEEEDFFNMTGSIHDSVRDDEGVLDSPSDLSGRKKEKDENDEEGNIKKGIRNEYICLDCGHTFDEPDKGKGRMLITGSATEVGTSLGVIAIAAVVLPLLGVGGIAYGGILGGVILLTLKRFFPMEKPYGFIRAAFKTMGFLSLMVGVKFFVGNRPIFNLIPLIIGAVGVLLFPSTVSSSKADERQFEAFMTLMRTVYSGAVGFMFAVTFSSAFTSGNPALMLSLGSLIFAFFFIVPDVKNITDSDSGFTGSQSEEIAKAFQEAGEGLGDGLQKKLPDGDSSWGHRVLWTFFISVIFLPPVLALLGRSAEVKLSIGIGGFVLGLYVFIGVARKAPKNGFNGLAGLAGLVSGIIAVSSSPIGMVLFLVVVSTGLMVAIPIPEARPIMGVIILPIALMAMTASYPDVMGESVFGEWWPTVNAKMQEVQKTASPAMSEFTEVQGTLGKGWTCLSSPVECYRMYEAEGEVEKEYQALGISRLDPIGIGRVSDVTELDEPESTAFSSTFSIKNALESDEYINSPVIRDLDLKAKKAEFIGRSEKDTATERGDIVGPHCNDDGECDIDRLDPGVEHQYRVKYLKKHFKESPAGDQLKYGVEAEYNVNTSSVLDVEIMNSSEFMDRSARDEIDFRNPESTYEWGPIEIGMAASRQQPIEGDESISLTVTLKNRDSGYMPLSKLEDIDITTSNAEWLKDGEDELDECNIKDKLEKEFDKIDAEGLQAKDKEYNSITVSCDVEVDELSDVPSRTYDLRIDMSYRYAMETTSSIEVMYDDEEE
ncbi:MAG: hypothetical protein ACLFQ8_00010 [Candidatus Aenigmatarchaeota archaeon]